MGKRQPIAPPICPHCNRASELVTGADIYRGRDDLADKFFYRCRPCDAWCGCHPRSKRPLGVPAKADLRRARSLLHERRLDPLWKTALTTADYHPEDRKAVAIITNTARKRVYEWLAYTMGLKEFHAGECDIDQCREAWILLSNITYPEIRAWAKARPKPLDSRQQEAKETA